MELENHIDLKEKEKEKTKIQALIDVWNREESSISPYPRAAYYTASFIALGFAIPSGYPYWPIGSKLLTAAFNLSMENPVVMVLAYYLGGSSAATNSFFNIWVMARYMQMFEPVSAERNIIYASARNWKTWARLILLHFEAIFANFAMGYVALEESNFKIDFWVVDSIFIGLFIAYVNLDTFLDSVLPAMGSAINKMREHFFDSKEEKDVAKAIQQYFSALRKMHQTYKLQRGDLENFPQIPDDCIDKKTSLTFSDIAPYILGGIFAAGTFMGRLGVISKSYNAAELIVNKLNVAKVSDWFASGTTYGITGLAVLPPLAFGIKTSNTFGSAVYQLFYDKIYDQTSRDKSIAAQTYPTMATLLLLGFAIFVLGSFGGNAYLNVQAAGEAVAALWWYYFATAVAAPIISNGFGVFALANDVVGRAAGTKCISSGDEYLYATEAQFLAEYELLANKALKDGDNKSAIELLIYWPHLILRLEDFGISKDDLGKIAASVKFTTSEKSDMIPYLNKKGAKLQDEKDFDNHYNRIFELTNSQNHTDEILEGRGASNTSNTSINDTTADCSRKEKNEKKHQEGIGGSSFFKGEKKPFFNSLHVADLYGSSSVTSSVTSSLTSSPSDSSDEGSPQVKRPLVKKTFIVTLPPVKEKPELHLEKPNHSTGCTLF